MKRKKNKMGSVYNDEVRFNIKKCPICSGMMSNSRNTCCLSCAKRHMEKKYKK